MALLFDGCVARRHCSFACCHSSRPQKPPARAYASPLWVNPSKHAFASARCPSLRSDQQSEGAAANTTVQAVAANTNDRARDRDEETLFICLVPPAPSPIRARLRSTASCSPPDPSPLSGTSMCRSFVPTPPSVQAMLVSRDRLPPAGLRQDATR